MGYYTMHKIRIINEYNTPRNLELLKVITERVSEYHLEIEDGAIIDYASNAYGTKWYGCLREMRLVSTVFPEFLIQFKGKGEEHEIWEFRIQNGISTSVDCTSFSDDEDEEEEIDENVLDDNELLKLEKKPVTDEINRR